MEIRNPADQLPNNAENGCISPHAAMRSCRDDCEFHAYNVLNQAVGRMRSIRAVCSQAELGNKQNKQKQADDSRRRI